MYLNIIRIQQWAGSEGKGGVQNHDWVSGMSTCNNLALRQSRGPGREVVLWEMVNSEEEPSHFPNLAISVR